MIQFDNTYENLPETFYNKSGSIKFSNPQLIAYNDQYAKDVLGINLDSLSKDELADLFSGQVIPHGASSIAFAYAGHQFGGFSPQLGDGRALLLGEVVSPGKKRFDIHFKGTGPTVYSRNGDGMSALGPVIREYIVSEAMFHLNVPTTRALAAVRTGDNVFRETKLPGGVFTRVAASHIRIGTFEYFAARKDIEGLKALVDYTINRHYPEINKSKNKELNKYLLLLSSVASAQSMLIAHWMSLGFIHGVMNTDNMAISGETIDFGPCAFMDNFSQTKTFSSIDNQGRYAYNNQIPVGIWNLFRLADCIVPLIDPDFKRAVNIVEESVESYLDIYENNWLDKMTDKLGIFVHKTEDKNLIDLWLKYLEGEDLDFTNSFRLLGNSPEQLKPSPLLEIFLKEWKERLAEQNFDEVKVKNHMNSVNPVFIPRNHQVEKAIQGAILEDYTIFEQLNEVLKNPFLEQPEFEKFKVPPLPEERITETFCGT